MRKLNAFLTAIIIFVCVGLSAQEPKPFLDTVKINCENKVLIRIAVYDQAALKKDTSIQSLILELQKNLGKINNNLPEGNYKVVYKPDQSLVIEQLTTISRYTLSGDTIAPFLLNNECEVATEKYNLTLPFCGTW